MKAVGIFYATREGHTKLIAQHLAMRLREAGLEVKTVNLKHPQPEQANPNRYGAAIVAASVHGGSHEREMIRFARQHRAELDSLPNVFISVNLSQVGASDASRSPAERARFQADVETMVAHFRQKTGWTPRTVKPVAGALPYSRYNFLIRFLMKRIARKNGAPTDTSHDYDFTNWADLDQFAATLAAELRRAAAA